ncbi:HTH-type transcriptional regulator ImmR [Sporomusa ovata DSM 2662]|uniref:HTH cro/C1-type domain-containing protein n=1 Tax=Sporomusa ovata TaxID=2378 RepID=A0A0U1KVN6_9FIRM|nr:helix-turn-helix transcriptional regulator [Sporomusa ovata]EQB29304.1 transcriptional regulator [Sporomusa ovata DSM 2662]CQR71345.1 hypothetical protein SpAn4DRAFT_3850 [Sporomusa ovata]
MKLGDRVKQLREKSGQTQQELGENINMKQQEVSNIERGIRKMLTPNELVKLAAALGVTIAELLDATDQQAACLPKTG